MLVFVEESHVLTVFDTKKLCHEAKQMPNLKSISSKIFRTIGKFVVNYIEQIKLNFSEKKVFVDFSLNHKKFIVEDPSKLKCSKKL